MKLSPLILDETRRRLGAAGAGGLALGFAALVYLAAIVAPAALEAARAGARPERSGVAAPAPGPAAPDTGASFLAGLPDATATAPVLAEIYAAAAREQLSLARAEYQFAPAGDPVFQLYQIHAPVRGSYVQVRRFIQAALKRVPGMALEEVSFRRQTIGEAQVEARVRFTVYLRKGRS